MQSGNDSLRIICHCDKRIGSGLLDLRGSRLRLHSQLKVAFRDCSSPSGSLNQTPLWGSHVMGVGRLSAEWGKKEVLVTMCPAFIPCISLVLIPSKSKPWVQVFFYGHKLPSSPCPWSSHISYRTNQRQINLDVFGNIQALINLGSVVTFLHWLFCNDEF